MTFTYEISDSDYATVDRQIHLDESYAGTVEDWFRANVEGLIQQCVKLQGG